MKLHELSVKRPVAVTMAVLIFVVIGAYALSMLPIDAMPDMDLKMVLVMTNYSNVGSEEIENLVTKPVEGAVASVSGLDTLRSQSSEGSSIVMAQFTNKTDIDEAVSTIENNINMISATLPEDADEPMVLKLDMSSMASAMMSVSYEGYDLTQTKKFVEDNVEDKLKAVDGVASVTVSGGTDRIIDVDIDPDKMYGYNLSFSDIIGAISGQNRDLPAGRTEANKKKLSVRVMGKFKKLSEIGLVPLTTSQGQIIYLRDVASINDTYEEADTYSRVNGEESISISVSGESDANTVDVVNGVKKALEQIKSQNPKFKYNITMEQASYIEDSIHSVAENAITGGLLAILVLFLFLGSARNALVIGVSMPISVITTFIGLYATGMTLNIVSLGGLALGVGMLVDNSVVVLENIFRRRKTYHENAKTASIKGTGEVIGAVVASVLTTCIVYVPILFIDNMMAIMFKQLAFTIVFSQTASLLTTFLIVPMLSSKIENAEEQNKAFGFILKPFEKMMNFFYSLYEKALRYFLKRRKRFMAGVMLLFVLSLVVLSKLGMTLMASSDEGTISISVELPQGSRLEDTDKICRQIEDSVKDYKELKTISVDVGSGGMMSMGTTPSNQASITLTLEDDRKTSTADAVQIIREKLSDITGATLSIEASDTNMSMSSDEVSFRYTASDDEALEDYVRKAEKVLAGIKGVTETETSLSDTKPELRVKLDKSKAALYGMNTSYAASLVSNALNGSMASKYFESGSEYDIKVKYPTDYVKNYDELKKLRIKSPMGQWITLSDIADVTIEQGQTTLQRIDQKRVVTLTGKIYGSDMGTVNRQFNEAINKEIGKAEGISQEAAGSYEVMMDAMKSLLIAILLGILLMYMVMAAQFENLTQPFIILFTIPLAMIGVVLAVLISGTAFSVVSAIGVLMLIGIIVNNAIVLIDFINQEKAENPEKPRTQRVVNAGLVRMRPILMTSLTSILGFLPMAVTSTSGGAMMQPLAVVLVGGLSVGTFLTLFVIPVVYTIFDDFGIKRAAKKQRRAEKKAMKKAQA